MNTTKRSKDIETLKSGYTTSVRIFEIMSIFSYIILAIFTLYTLQDFILANPFYTLLLLSLGWIAADVTTGLLHWLFDTWGKFDWPILGKLFVRPFLEHHISPNEITEHDWVETNGSNLFVGLSILGITLLLSNSAPLITLVLFLSFWGSMTNQFHKWSHQAQVPRYVTVLQKIGLILPIENHKKHHRDEFAEHYCITNGIMNSFLDQIGFFRFLEWSIQKITGLKPRDNDLP